MIDNSQLWIERAEQTLEHGQIGGSESVQFAISMLTAVYGSASPQIKQFQDGCSYVSKSAQNPQQLEHYLRLHGIGAIRNTTNELKGGLVVRLRVAIAGEILQELIRLAKESLTDHTPEGKDAAAVLIAAAYEGLIRKMGEEFAGVKDRPKLEEVITILKTEGVLRGGQVGTARSYLKFRNDSLHADWKNVDRSQVESCLAFSESLLLKHFAS